MSRLPSGLGVLAIAPLLLVLAAGRSNAQGTTGASIDPDGKWEVEFHGGGGLVNNPTDGSGALPPAGASFTTAAIRTSRRVSSWYFGDGATLLNQVNVNLGLRPGQSIIPLDPVLKSALSDREPGASLGFRVSREITPRFGAELTFDYGLGDVKMNSAALVGIEAARASFITAWYSLLTTGPFLNQTVTSVATIQNGDAKQLFTAGAIDVNLRTTGRLIPYVTGGGGILSNFGETPSATLTGNYAFLSLSLLSTFTIFPVNETDTITIRTVRDKHTFVGVLGGGMKYAVSKHWGVRVDARSYLSRDTTRTVVDANPVVATLMPAGGIASSTTPSMQFSNNPTLTSGAQSTLSGGVINGFETFKSSGIQRRIDITAGITVRF